MCTLVAVTREGPEGGLQYMNLQMNLFSGSGPFLFTTETKVKCIIVKLYHVHQVTESQGQPLK